MGNETAAPMGWGTIFAVMLATGLVTGLVVGVLQETAGIEGGTAAVGVSIGVVGALLISRRRLALRQQQKRE